MVTLARMKTWGVIVVVLLGACAGPVPECVEDAPGSVWSQAVCGEFRGDSVTFIDHGDGTRSLARAVCSDDWSFRCDDTTASGDYDDGIPVCSDIDAAPTCENGEAPRCVVVPCDGTTYYGPGHPGE